MKCDWRCTESCDKEECLKVRVPCEEGCFCEGRPNIIRIDGVCVKREDDCPEKECPDNEEWTLGNDCSDRCPDIACEGRYWYDCFCVEGYVRINGECVPDKECDKCPEDKEWRDCGNPCDDVCPNTKVFCPDKCYPGCYCKNGYVEINGKCVDPREYCPEDPCCGPDQVYRWGNNCSFVCGMENQYCDTGLRLGCFCKEGFRWLDGKCIPVEECPQECVEVCTPACPEGMYYTECGSKCKNSCTPDKECERSIQECTKGCFCKEANEMTVGGKCVPKAEVC